MKTLSYIAGSQDLYGKITIVPPAPMPNLPVARLMEKLVDLATGTAARLSGILRKHLLLPNRR